MSAHQDVLDHFNWHEANRPTPDDTEEWKRRVLRSCELSAIALGKDHPHTLHNAAEIKKMYGAQA